jgi:hypothetical protein
MFRALLAHLQEALHSNNWYIACVLCLLAATSFGVELVTSVSLRNFIILLDKQEMNRELFLSG